MVTVMTVVTVVTVWVRKRHRWDDECRQYRNESHDDLRHTAQETNDHDLDQNIRQT